MKIYTFLKVRSIAKKIKLFAGGHKVITVVLILALGAIGYLSGKLLFAKAPETRYITAVAAKDAVLVTVSGTGQVSSSNQFDIKPKVSGDVISIPVSEGQAVKAGAIIMQLDAKDAQKTVRDALVSLQSAQLSLQKLEQPADALSITQAENTLARATESKQNAESNLAKSYDDASNIISNAFLDLPTAVSGIQSILFSNDSTLGGNGIWNIDYYANAIARYDTRAQQFREDAYQKYQIAKQAYDKAFSDYKTSTRSSDPATVEALINETYDAANKIADAIKSTNNLIQLYQDKMTEHGLTPVLLSNTHLSSLTSYTGKVNTHLSNLLNEKNAIKTNKDAIVNADRTIAENTASLAKLKAGSDPLDIQSAKLSVEQRRNALIDAQQKLADYTIRAPFAGTIAKIDAKKADTVGSGTAVATLLTDQQVAEISLNEVDIAKVKVDQKATMTFDAVDGLSVTGKVVEVDALGTVSQGVVTYTVKIAFDVQDERIKSGMSVSAAVITDMKNNVLTVPSSAVKTQNNASYVEVLDPALLASSTTGQGVISKIAPARQLVQTGLANDSLVEIISGLEEGAVIVTRTLATSTATKTTQTTSLFSTGGATRAVGGSAPRN